MFQNNAIAARALHLDQTEKAFFSPRFAADIRKETLERNIRKETSEKTSEKRYVLICINCIFIFNELFAWNEVGEPRQDPVERFPST